MNVCHVLIVICRCINPFSNMIYDLETNVCSKTTHNLNFDRSVDKEINYIKGWIRKLKAC